MKSIKEKSIEIYPALEGDLSSTSENLVRRNGFQTGANYVLDAIVDVINQPMNDYLMLGELKKVILQLKK